MNLETINYSPVMLEEIRRIARESVEVKSAFFNEQADSVVRAAELLIDAIRSGGKVLVFGNGGSAADAQHIAAELVNRLNFDRAPVGAIALTTDTSILTSIGNDSSFDEVFERQLRALGRKGDVAIAISTSGNSSNVIRAVEAARELGVKTIAFSGRSGGRLVELSDLALTVNSNSTQRIQETHITIGHVLCELVEQELFGK